MRTNLNTLLGAAAIVTVLASGPTVYAAETQNQQGSGGMMQGGQGGMMNMMGQMSQMMETCNKMMQGMAQHHAPETQKDEPTPEKKR
ncbi:MAG: hypothetical protein RIA64_14525 [Rhodospirillales bacterium]